MELRAVSRKLHKHGIYSNNTQVSNTMLLQERSNMSNTHVSLRENLLLID